MKTARLIHSVDSMLMNTEKQASVKDIERVGHNY